MQVIRKIDKVVGKTECKHECGIEVKSSRGCAPTDPTLGNGKMQAYPIVTLPPYLHKMMISI